MNSELNHVEDRAQNMTLRDYFAGQALTGMIKICSEAKLSLNETAQWAYTLADAMLVERKESNDK